METEKNSINTAIEKFSEDEKALAPLAKALLLHKQGFTLSAVCKAVGIHRSQLTRAKGAMGSGAPTGVQGRPQYLTTEQEVELKKWCFSENDAGRSPTLDAIRTKAHSLAVEASTKLTDPPTAVFGPPPPSTTWYQGFLQRHEDLKTIVAKMEPGRQTNPKAQKFREYFEKTLKPLFNKWNYDSHLEASSDDGEFRITATSRPQSKNVQKKTGVQVAQDVANKKKRKRSSSSSPVLTSQENATQMMEAEKTDQPAPALTEDSHDPPPKKKVFEAADLDADKGVFISPMVDTVLNGKISDDQGCQQKTTD